MKYCPKCGKEMTPVSGNIWHCYQCKTTLEKRWVLLQADECNSEFNKQPEWRKFK